MKELKKLAPAEGEWDALAAEHSRLAHGSSLLAGAQSSLEALSEAEGACVAQLAAVAQRLRELSEHDQALAPIVEMLAGAEAQAGEAVRELRHYASRIELDPEALRSTEARIEALHAAARKHRVRPEQLWQLARDLATRLADLELAGNPEALRKQVEAAGALYDSECVCAFAEAARRGTGVGQGGEREDAAVGDGWREIRSRARSAR